MARRSGPPRARGPRFVEPAEPPVSTPLRFGELAPTALYLLDRYIWLGKAIGLGLISHWEWALDDQWLRQGMLPRGSEGRTSTVGSRSWASVRDLGVPKQFVDIVSRCWLHAETTKIRNCGINGHPDSWPVCFTVGGLSDIVQRT